MDDKSTEVCFLRAQANLVPPTANTKPLVSLELAIFDFLLGSL